MALNVDKVYRFVQFVANKESRGWISPAEFNIAAELAQIAVYSRLEAQFLLTKKIHSDMRPFLKYATITDNTPRSFPAGFRQLLNARVVTTNVPVVELTQAELSDALNSQIVAPSATYPNCVVRDDGIQVYPATVTADVIIEYISKITNAPEWIDTGAGARPIYDSVSSTDFTFDDILFLEISGFVLANVGMNIKDEVVSQYGLAFNAQK
jgi:hypothetical protein